MSEDDFSNVNPHESTVDIKTPLPVLKDSTIILSEKYQSRRSRTQTEKAIRAAAEKDPKYVLNLDFPLSKGGFSYIYSSRCPYTNQPRIIKISNRAEYTPLLDKEANIQAFLANNLRNKYLVPQLYKDHRGSYVHMLGDNHFMVMDLVPGKDIASWIESDFFATLERKVITGFDIVSGIREIHNTKIVHGDLKPENIMIIEYGVVFVDFGAAEPTGEAINKISKQELRATIEYVAPEVFTHLRHSVQSDIFSTGIMLYEILTGMNPRAIDDIPRGILTDFGKTKKIIDELPPIPPLEQYHIVNKRLAHIIAKMTSLDPEKRYQSMEEVNDEFKAYLKSENLPTNP